MKFVADVHLHSFYSRATSKNLNFEHLTKWAQLKGVNVVGTGDIAHPGWLEEMRTKLEPAEEGLFRLRPEYADAVQAEVPEACHAPVRFMLAGEISNIYKKGEKTRKIHTVSFLPSLDAVERLQSRLEKIGNIRSDGRPILGLDVRDLFEIVLEMDEQAHMIPAHIWTPWFSMLGSKSGYDSVEECFEDLTPHIFALETGLSSDPPMNWRVSNLDRYTLVSNSDAHSPQKLAREANVFNTELSYPAFFDALKAGNTGDDSAFWGTIEFFPEEGKYHYDGHRKCNLRWHPQTTIAHDGRCEVCGRAVTVGVMHRVEELADRPEGERPPIGPSRTQNYKSLVPLPEVLGEVMNVGPTSKRVQKAFDHLLATFGSELTILQDVPLDDLTNVGGSLLSEGIRRMREGNLTMDAGYDGEYGIIKLFEEDERDKFSGQMGLFPVSKRKSSKKSSPKKAATTKPKKAAKPARKEPVVEVPPVEGGLPDALNAEQMAAVQCVDRSLLIVAGPGTGKTRTLTHRIAHLITEKQVAPESILAITFTNKAAQEMRLRLDALMGTAASRVVIKTFHAFGVMMLREIAKQNLPDTPVPSEFAICSEKDQQRLMKQLMPEMRETERNRLLEQISTAKSRLQTVDDVEDAALQSVYSRYQATLQENNLFDFDDLILMPVRLLEGNADLLASYQNRFRWISVDEYQDINLAQYRFLSLLTGRDTMPDFAQNNLCAIGDPNQAIYGFRGADRTYFLRFQEDFPDATVLHLQQNYRSTQMILAASGQVIAQEQDTPDYLRTWSDFVDNTKLDIRQSPTDKAEAEYVVHQIEQMVGGTSYFSLDSGRVDDRDDHQSRSFGDFAVLYRLNAQNRLLIEAFQRSGIPFQTVGQISLYEQAEVQLMLAYLRYAYNPNALYYLTQLLEDRLSSFTAEKMQVFTHFADENQLSLCDAVQRYAEIKSFSKVQRQHLSTVVPFLQGLIDKLRQQPIATSIDQVVQFLWPEAKDGLNDTATERIEQVRLQATQAGNDVQAFLESTALQKEVDFYDPRADRVTLMTLHASKGLEFPVVFMVGCEENMLPYRKPSTDEIDDVDEERRLFYVGMTRAQQKLVLTHAKSRLLYGQRKENPLSRFANDIEQTLIALQETNVKRKKKAEEPAPDLQMSLFD
ncbi:MAG: UvrD-helicase domain-containing protein [Chloroflexota bacterium]